MLTPGGTLGGRYRLDERIATGGMGDVWKAEDTVLGRVVAVKILQSALLEEPGFAERFRAEARAMATINHPGVVRVYDYGETEIDGGGKVAYLVMEHVEGEALSRALNRVGRLTPERTMSLLAQAGEALQAAHDHGIVHRDVKPGNLLVRPDGKLVVIDFGIARSAMSGQLTTAGSILGTASYVSPEQASGSSEITPASDVYSLGVVGYQCMSGRRPFEGENPLQVAMKHIQDVPPPLPADVPVGIREVIERAMAKDPAQRWPSASAMADASRRAGAGGPPTSALGAPAPDRTSVMPAGAASGPRPGQYSAGAASIPSGSPPGAHTETGVMPGAEPRKGRRKGLLAAAIVVAALVVLAGIGGIGYALVNHGSDDPGDGKAAQTGSPTPGKPSQDSDGHAQLPDYTGQSYQQAAADVQDRGYNPVRREGPKAGARPGTVTNVEYDQPLHQGESVYLYVQPGNDNDDGGGATMPNMPGPNGGGDNDDDDDGGNTQSPTEGPTSTPTTTEPTTTPTDGDGDGNDNDARTSSFIGGGSGPMGMNGGQR